MSKSRKNQLRVEKDKRDEMLDAIIGADEEMTDEIASEILTQYGVDETRLLDNFKSSVRERLREIPTTGDESKRLGAMLRNIAEHQRISSPESASPKDWIAGLMGRMFPQQRTVSYSFRDKKEGELPASDQDILDGLKKELDGDDGETRS